MSESKLALLINLAALGVYAYSANHMLSPKFSQNMKTIVPPPLHIYGQLKFLTFHCLMIQIFSSLLHVLAFFIRPLRPVRDFIFTTLAYPLGSIVVYTFWAVWILLGRELILPAKMDPFYPTWLNHATHTIIAPVNIILALLIHHKYTRRGFLVTLIYFGLYTVFLYVIKAQTGLFVYGYLNQFSEIERQGYFAGTALFAYVLYKSGQTLTSVMHGGADHKAKQQTQKTKQKQR